MIHLTVDLRRLGAVLAVTGILMLGLTAGTWAIGCVVDVSQGEGSTAAGPLGPESASDEFWDTWSDGRGEVSAYRLTTPRYGELREGMAVLVYVLEQADDRTWIKDDRSAVPPEHQTVVMKLNEVTSFRTGIYPYRLMASVFSPVNSSGRERFAPTRIVFTSQEWCGQVYHRVMPAVDRFTNEIRSYFSVEGEQHEVVRTEPLALYEDALLIQLRELDGLFADGGDWSGQIVPSLWQQRRSHEPLSPVEATITRTEAVRDGVEVNRFVLRYEDRTRTFDVEREGEQRVLSWATSEGEEATLIDSTRLPYWQLNEVGDESLLAEIGLDEEGEPLVEGDDG